MTLCLNNTNEDVQALPSTVFFHVCRATLVVLTVFGNLLVIVSISHFKQLHTPTNFIILSLATVDMMVGITDLPLLLVSKSLCLSIDLTFCYIAVMCSYHVTFLSIYNVTLISLDRFYALSYPFKYSKRVTVKGTSVVICSMWCISFMYNLALVYSTKPCSATENRVKIIEIWANIDFLVAFIVPCSVIIILYIKIFVIARKHAKHIQCTKGRNSSKNTKYRDRFPKDSERKAAMKLGILVIVFVICLLPYFLVTQLSVFIPVTIIDHVFDTTVFIVQLNSAVNPIIYALFYPWFRRCAKFILTLKIFSCDSSISTALLAAGQQW